MLILHIFLFLIFCTTLTGCSESGSNKSDQINDIRETLEEYETLLNSGNYEDLRRFYADDPRFSFFEDGQVKYSSVEEVASALKQLAQFGPGRFEYGEPQKYGFLVIPSSPEQSLQRTRCRRNSSLRTQRGKH